MNLLRSIPYLYSKIMEVGCMGFLSFLNFGKKKRIKSGLMQGFAYLEHGQYQEALDTFKQVIRLEPDNARAYLGLGEVYLVLGLGQEALDAFEHVIRLDPDDAIASIAYCELAQAYLELNPVQYKKALDVCEQVIEMAPGFFNIIKGTYDFIKSWEETIDFSKECVRLNPDVPCNYVELGFAYLRFTYYQEAIEAFKQAVRLDPNYVEAYKGLGLTYHRLGQYQKALDACEQMSIKIIKINPNDADAIFDLGEVYLELGQYQKALDAFEQALKLDPEYELVCLKSLGDTYLKQGQYQKAVDAYKQFIEIDPDDADVHLRLGKGYLELGDMGSVLKEYKILKNLDKKTANRLLGLIYRYNNQ